MLLSAVQNAIFPPQYFSKKSSSVSLWNINESNISQLQTLNSELFPVKYSPQFYENILNGESFGLLATHDNQYVGAIVGRLQPYRFTEDFEGNFNRAGYHQMETYKRDVICGYNYKEIYIMTLGVLSSHRRLGIGRALIDSIIEDSKKNKDIKKIVLHVQSSNSSALAFYKNYGFEVSKLVKEYYRLIPSPDAYILTLELKNRNKTPI
ncbi:hypothetical protein BB559_007434 [Furculomyces boomerangus]|uniref:N-acetyltransferase domain-containing protein n=2 Tax=Harpellales TaxID=61421 RepID=A0A2T9XXF3_9FUNG|nr:hypothetical protein BB559_007434 [Furculomyces boomerangus]PVZ97726.1 hypothetical protein BB558_006287 [Smittium angustum]